MEDLELEINNPYVNATLLVFTDHEELSEMVIDVEVSTSDRYYEIGIGDSLSNISFESYDDSSYWFLLYAANDFIENPLDLSPYIGYTLRVPDLQTYLSKNDQ